jgi:hypothetical protein
LGEERSSSVEEVQNQVGMRDTTLVLGEVAARTFLVAFVVLPSSEEEMGIAASHLCYVIPFFY